MKSKSIARKLSMLIIGLFLVLFVIYSIVTSVILHGKSVDDAENLANEHAKLNAAKVKERFEETNETLQTSKHVFESLRNEGKMTAQSVLTFVQNNLEENKHITGMAVVLEKDSIPVESNIDKNLIDTQKRFIPYLHKEGEKVVVSGVTGYSGDEAEDWFTIPEKENRAVLTEPYEYVVGEDTIYMSTLSIPLHSKDGQFIGVMTADFSIDFVNELVKENAPESGYAGFITNKGVVVANSVNDKLIGTNMEDTVDWKNIKKELDNNQVSNFYIDSKQLQEKAFNSIAPVHVEGIDEVWSLQTVMPKSFILTTFNKILIVTIISAIAMIILMSAVSYWFIHKQLNPLLFLKKAIETAAAGDLTTKVDNKHIRNDEIGAVTVAFNQMLEQTNDVMNTVMRSSKQLNQSSNEVYGIFEEISASSEEVAIAVDEIAQGATHQSEDTENTNDQMIQLSTQIDALSTLSEGISQLSNATSESTKQGMQQVSQLRNNNESTNILNENIQKQIQLLSSKISAIDSITTSIQNITSQTNLLALNASIEAARAGEHGKGFAVVADEVKKLAAQSSHETDVIQATVQEILQESQETVSIIEKNMELMELNNQSVSDTETSFKHQAGLASQLGNSISELSAKLADMMNSKEEAILSIQNISAISEETAASAEQVSASAAEQQNEMARATSSTEQMKNIAGELQEVVNRFTIE